VGAEEAFRTHVERAVRERVAYPRTPPIDVVSSPLGADGGLVGAALSATLGTS
jgi:hypothetical protein